MTITVSLPRAGLVKADLDLRLYTAAGASDAVHLGAVSLTPVSGTLYNFAGLPESAGMLTWSTDGSSGAETWGISGVPPGVVLPVRIGGLSASAFSLQAIRNGAVFGGALIAPEIGSPGDYFASGWPSQMTGATWELFWTYDGGTYRSTWQELAAPRTGTKDQLKARADLKKDGRPVLYVFPSPPVDPVLGEPPAGGGAQVQTYAVVQTAQRRIVSGSNASKGEGLADNSLEITVPTIDFIPTPPVAGGTFYLAPSGQKTFPVPGDPGVRALRMTTLYDALADGVDEILYIALASGDGPPRPN